jgi:hypothetical protein
MKKADIGGVIGRMLGEDGGRAAESSLTAYFFPGAYTGANFEKYAQPGTDKFTAEDIVAVSMLSVDIPAPVSNWILGDGSVELTKLLQKLPTDATIKTMDMSKGSDSWKLWKAIFQKRGMGETKTSKLTAAKRPELFPVYDKHVARALGISKDNYWAPWQEFICSDDGARCTKIVEQMATRNAITGIPVLRLFDVVVWMRQHGYKAITPKLVEDKKMINVTYASPFV